MKKTLLLVFLCAAATILTSCEMQDKLFEKQTGSESMVFDNSEFDDVAANFEKALQSDPDFAQNYIDLADSYIKAGQPDKAVSTLYRGYEITQDAGIKNRIDDFFRDYSYDFVPLKDTGECKNIFTLSEFDTLSGDDYFDFTAGVVLVNNDTKEQTIISAVKLKGADEWNFVQSDLNLIGRHFNLLLIQAYYAPGCSVTFIYDTFKNTIEELESGLTFAAYSNNYLNCSEDFILASPKAYDVETLVPLIWYDWNGNAIKLIENTQPMFTQDKLYYIVKEENDTARIFKVYTSDYDGSNADLISTIKGENIYKNLSCFFWNENELIYAWIDENGERTEVNVKINELEDIYLK